MTSSVGAFYWSDRTLRDAKVIESMRNDRMM
nr:MAG TPA: hypothetical protein [Caudoviricetes sp.]